MHCSLQLQVFLSQKFLRQFVGIEVPRNSRHAMELQNIPKSYFRKYVSAEVCDGGHTCSSGCCYNILPQMGTSVADMFTILIWTYWTAAVLAALAAGAACGYWLWKCRRSSTNEDCSLSDRASSASCYLPPHYSRCNSFVQTMPPPYNEVTSKPDLYPLVIGYDDGFGKGASGFVMRYFRSLSHTSTLDSLSSSFMCNVVNDANTIIPPPYSCNSVDQLSIAGCERVGNMDGSVVSLANQRTVSDISSLVAQSPSSPPRATSPTLELRELLDKIQQLPQLPSGHSPPLPSCQNQNRPHFLYPFNNDSATLPQPPSPSEASAAKSRRSRGKVYMSVPLSARNKAKRWLSRSAPTTPSGTVPMSFLPGQSRRPSDSESNNQQVVPLLAEQDETENNNIDNT